MLPGFKTTITTQTIILDAAVRLVFTELEKRYPKFAFQQLAKISSGGTPSRNISEYYGGNIPWVKISDITKSRKWISSTEESITQSAIDNSSAKLFPANTVLFSMYGSIGKTAITNCPLTTNQAILGLIPNPEVKSEYLYYSLIFARQELFNSAKGTSQKNINGELVKNFEIPFPPPEIVDDTLSFLVSVEDGITPGAFSYLPDFIREQYRIVKRIEKLAGRVREALSLREKAIKETEKLAFTEARKIISDLKFPNIKLGELVNQYRNGIQTGPFGAQLGSSDFIDSGFPVITIGNVQYSGLVLEHLKYISTAKAEQLKRFSVQEGDILFARMGTVGRCCVVPKSAEGWIYNYHLIRVALDKNRVDPRFIHWLIRASADIETKLDEKIRGATREGVNSKIVASLPCCIPSLDEQRRIVTHLDAVQAKVDELRRLQAETKQELAALLPSILDKAFKGEL